VNEIGLIITESVYVTQSPHPIFQMIFGGGFVATIFSGAQIYRFARSIDVIRLALI